MSEYISFGSHRNLFLYSQWIRRHLNKLHGNLGILSLISTASQQKINKNFLSMTALGHHKSVYYRNIPAKLWYMLNRTLKTNLEPRWPLKSNLELRWPPFVCHAIWTRAGRFTLGRFGTIRVGDQSNNKTSLRENTYVRNGPVEYAHSLYQNNTHFRNWIWLSFFWSMKYISGFSVGLYAGS